MLSFFAQQPRITRTFKMLKRILQASTAATDSRQQHADNILLSCLAQEKKNEATLLVQKAGDPFTSSPLNNSTRSVFQMLWKSTS